MKRRARVFAALLAACSLLAMLAGCSPSSEAEASVPESVSPSAGSSAQPRENDAEPAETDPYAVILPLTEDQVTIEIWSPDTLMAYNYVDNIDDVNTTYKRLEEVTGLTLNITRFPDPTVGLALVIASGQLPDMFLQASNYYSGGSAKGVEEGVFLDLSDYVEAQVPNYWRILESDRTLEREARSSDGGIHAFYTIYDRLQYPIYGPIVRADWVDALGLKAESINTLDAYHDYLAKARSEYGAQLLLFSCGAPWGNWLVGAFGVPGFLSTTRQAYPFYQVDGKVDFGMVQPEYREYLEMMRQWYAEGLISDELYTWTNVFGLDKDIIASEKISMFHWLGQMSGEIVQLSENPDFSFVGISDVTDANMQNPFGEPSSLLALNTTEISATTEHLDLVLSLINYSYTEEGSLTWYMGGEGETWEYDSAGVPTYTELMTDNPLGMAFSLVGSVYAMQNFGPHVNYTYVQDRYYDDMTMNSFTTWAASLDTNNTRNLPTTLALANDDAAIFTNVFSEVSTYALESVTQFLVGTRPLTDEEWDEYVAGCYKLGLQDCVDMYQRAYDIFLSK